MKRLNNSLSDMIVHYKIRNVHLIQIFANYHLLLGNEMQYSLRKVSSWSNNAQLIVENQQNVPYRFYQASQ